LRNQVEQGVPELGRERASRGVAHRGRAEKNPPAVTRLVFLDGHRLEGVELDVQHVLQGSRARTRGEPEIQRGISH
jgi:hypothetical protein